MAPHTSHSGAWFPLGWGPSAPAEARGLARRLSAAHALQAATRHRLLLVVSELVSNAVQHGLPPVAIRISLGEDAIGVEVSDGSLTTPKPRSPDTDGLALRGRGLGIVGTLSSDWGWRTQPPGKAVWCEVPR